MVVATLLVAIAFGALYVLPGGWGKPAATMKFIVSDRDQDRVFSDAEMARTLNNELEALISEDFLRDALQRPRAQDTGWYRAQPNAEAAVSELQRAMRAALIEGTTCIELTLSLSPGEDARVLLQEYAETYLNRKKIMLDQATSNLSRLYIAERARAGDDVRAMRKQIDRFYQENDWLPFEIENAPLIELQRLHLETILEIDMLKAERSRLMPPEEDKALRPELAETMTPGPSAPEPLPPADRNEARISELDQQINRQHDLLSILEPQMREAQAKMTDWLSKENDLALLKHDLEILRAKQEQSDQRLDELRIRSNREDYLNVKKLSDPVLQ